MREHLYNTPYPSSDSIQIFWGFMYTCNKISVEFLGFACMPGFNETFTVKWHFTFVAVREFSIDV